MSNYSTVETDKAVIRVHLTDGTMKSFLVTQSQTPNAVKFMVCKKLGLDVKEFNMFGLYVIEGDSSACTDVGENPFSLHVKWNAKPNSKSRFLFKRSDETWPKPKAEASPLSPRGGSPSTSQQKHQPPPASAELPQGHRGGYGTSSTGNVSSFGASEGDSSDYQDDGYGGQASSKGFGFGVTTSQLEAQRNVARRVDGNLSAKAQSSIALIGWMNKSLEHLGISVKNLTTDMSDGVVFFRLLELITHKTLKGWHTSPSNMMLKLDNLNMFLRILGYFGIKITGISPEDIFSGNENIITAILLLMIKKYTPTIQLEQYTEYAEIQSQQEEQGLEDDLAPPQEAAPLPPASRPASSIIANDANQQRHSGSASAAFASLAQPTSSPIMPPSRPSPPSDPVPMDPQDGSLASPRTSDSSSSSSGTTPRGRVRSRMVTPDEAQRALGGAAYVAKAPAKFAVDPSLTPDISTLLGPPIDMPLGNPQLLSGPSLMMPLSGVQTPSLTNSAMITPQFPLGNPLMTNTPLLQGPAQTMGLGTQPGLVPSLLLANNMNTLPTMNPLLNQVGTQPGSHLPPGTQLQTSLLQGPMQGAGTSSTAGGAPTSIGSTGSPGSVKKQPALQPTGANPKGVPLAGPKKTFAGPPKMAPGTVKMAPSAGLAKAGVPKIGGMAKRPIGAGGPGDNGQVRPNARPLPIPQPRLDEPREEMDITFVPQDAIQDSTVPAIEIDFSNPVPGSETAARAQRTRANTISNINTNVFDLDAFSDMEDLLLGLADNI